MTTNKLGSVNQQPLYGCTSCYEECTYPADHLHVYDNECWCDLCWDERRWEFPDQPSWNDLEPYTPALQAECKELRTALAESRANDLTAMGYLNQIRQLVGGDDFPDMVRRCEKLRKDAGTERQIQRAAQHLPEGWRIIVEVERDAGWIDAFNPDGRRIEIDWVGSLAEQIEQAIDAAMQEARA